MYLLSLGVKGLRLHRNPNDLSAWNNASYTITCLVSDERVVRSATNQRNVPLTAVSASTVLTQYALSVFTNTSRVTDEGERVLFFQAFFDTGDGNSLVSQHRHCFAGLFQILHALEVFLFVEDF